MKLISIIVPCLNEQEVIPIFYRTVTEVLDSLENAEYELLFVDDGSDDRTLKVLKELKKKDRRCRYLSFTRNFGKEAAIYAGLTHAKGDRADGCGSAGSAKVPWGNVPDVGDW